MMRFHGQPLAPHHVGRHAGLHARFHAKFHVFPEGRMCSLRRALMLWLVPMFLIVGAATAAFSYFAYRQMVNEFMDDQMQQLGQSVAAQAGRPTPPAQSAERLSHWGAYGLQVWSPDGRLQGSSWPQLALPLQAGPGFHDVATSDSRWRVYTSPAGTDRRQVQVFQSEHFRGKLAAERALSAFAPVLILLPLSILVLWLLSGAMSRAVQDIGREAAQQDVNSLTGLSTDRVPHELQPMVVSFNSLLARLRESFAMKRRFVQDAAHELRTPLTAVALQLENVRRDMPDGACQQSFAQLEAGVGRAQRLVDQLLKLSRQEAPVDDSASTLDLRAQLHESISALISLADQRRIDLGLVADGDKARAVTLTCSAGDLRSVVDNLIENALRYTPEGGVVDVRLVTNEAHPAIEIVDTGPGIPHDMLPRVFDRFFRVPGTAVNGSGLGLAIAQAAAQRCGLRIVLRNREDRSGLVARIESARIQS